MTKQMKVIEELAYARYDALMSDSSTHKKLIAFIYECLKTEADNRVPEYGEEKLPVTDIVNYLMFEEFPMLGITFRDFMCTPYVCDYDHFQTNFPRIFGFSD